MAKQQQTQQQAGGWDGGTDLPVAALLLLGVAARYWYLSDQHPPEPANAPVLTSSAGRGADDYPGRLRRQILIHLRARCRCAKTSVSGGGQAHGDLAAALREAKSTAHKRILSGLRGGDWCWPDCQVLDVYFHQGENAQLLADNFVKVNVNIGQMDARTWM